MLEKAFSFQRSIRLGIFIDNIYAFDMEVIHRKILYIKSVVFILKKFQTN